MHIILTNNIVIMFYIDSYEEAKRKANIAQDSSDLSEIEHNKETRKVRAKLIENSPSPSPKKAKLNKYLTPPKVFR